MKIGIIPNITKSNILDIVERIVAKLKSNDFEYFLSESLAISFTELPLSIRGSNFLKHTDLFTESDFVISIGGDGTMLTTAYEARHFDTPIIGINFGKLGFLAELDDSNLDELMKDLKENKYVIEERIALEAFRINDSTNKLYAINDIVIDKGGWPKMIELTVNVDDEYVTTFSADGIIIATPTGSTGYSLSTGGPIISPSANVIALNPISPHTLTMRPLILDSNKRLTITVNSLHSKIQINCDGQRVHYFAPPSTFEIYKSHTPIKLIHTKSTNYFEILRRKLYWGLDVRNNPNKKEEE